MAGQQVLRVSCKLQSTDRLRPIVLTALGGIVVGDDTRDAGFEAIGPHSAHGGAGLRFDLVVDHGDGWAQVAVRRGSAGSDEQHLDGPQSEERLEEPLPPRPARGQVQGLSSCRAADVARHGEVAPAHGESGHDALRDATEACAPAGQVVGHRRQGDPRAVGPEATRGHMVPPGPLLQVTDDELNLGVAAVVEFEHLALSVGDEGVVGVLGWVG